ncbi:MAG: type pilus assembly protein PilW, partial [Pseudomonadota bacterium]|nr:type pilus assembly protein PilW [Pseudomonadota bacterium]
MKDLCSRSRVQSGFSIIELMIAIVISMLLTAAVALLYSSSRASSRNQSDLSRTHESGRSAMYILARSIRQGGYLADPISWVDSQTVFPNGGRPVQGTEGAPGSNDTVTVSYQGSGPSSGVADNRVVDCLGNPVPYPTVSYPATPATIRRDVFSIANDPANSNEPTLFCDDGSGTN